MWKFVKMFGNFNRKWHTVWACPRITQNILNVEQKRFIKKTVTHSIPITFIISLFCSEILFECQSGTDLSDQMNEWRLKKEFGINVQELILIFWIKCWTHNILSFLLTFIQFYYNLLKKAYTTKLMLLLGSALFYTYLMRIKGSYLIFLMLHTNNLA